MNNIRIVALLIVVTVLSIANADAFAETIHKTIRSGAVYAMTNTPDDNQVVVFARSWDGSLTFEDSVSTGGNGSGGDLDPLASQGSLALIRSGRFLLAVNAGSNDVSLFYVDRNGLRLIDLAPSGGVFPVSLSVSRNLVYVLNAGSSTITTFSISWWGQLIPIDEFTRDLGTGGFAQVGVDPSRRHLVVTDRDENEILVFSLIHR